MLDVSEALLLIGDTLDDFRGAGATIEDFYAAIDEEDQNLDVITNLMVLGGQLTLKKDVYRITEKGRRVIDEVRELLLTEICETWGDSIYSI